eukprot:CAMPEP_0184485590 /NCGR_PEP_ID=MMETSP0113_2-20130426/7174_1 /TAXON_ID=91329 /ORGANISM="Norrisiella sphaerica, Strain BC52" /LENGTH=104 /DNA_ID=CAMNT_0026867099 /DNA_START=70 /DNA_END=384 /DNA_ORIENTATION=+
MAIETFTQEEYYENMGKTGTDMVEDDGITFAILAICLSIGMWAYEGGWVASFLSSIWSGFPTMLNLLQIAAGTALVLPILFSMTMMIIVIASWVKTTGGRARVC